MAEPRDARSTEHLAYWTKQLSANPPSLELPLARARSADRRFRAAYVQRALTAKGLAADAAAFDTLLAAWVAVLHRTAGQTDFVVGAASAGAVLPLRFDVSDEPSFAGLRQRVRDVAAAGRPHAGVGLPAICAALRCRELFQAMFALRADDVAAQRDGLELALVVEPGAGRADATLHYNSELFDAATVTRMLGHLETLLAGALADPSVAITRLPFLTAGELHQVLVEWNDKKIDFPREATLHDLFEQRVAETPNAVAATFRNGELTYAQVNERANRVAHLLISLGIQPDALVGISCERSFELVTGLMGIAKAGGAYVPMDPAYPRERLRFMLEDSQVPVLLTQKHLADSIPKSDAKIVFLDDAAQLRDQPATNPRVAMTSQNLAYVIYTSGSTGAPKGVVLNHQGRVNNFLDFNRRFDVGGDDRLIALASLSFDMCAYDVFGILASGAAIVLPEPEHMQDPTRWAQLMNERRVTIWHTAPAMLKMLVDHLEAQPQKAPQSLRLVLLGGDWIPVTLPDRLRALVPHTRVISMGGATECSMDSTIYEVRAVDPAWKSIPYGEPMKNQLAYVLDKHLQPLPMLVPGELYLGGIGVGRGYHKRPELTAERFLANPFVPNERMYKTGDLARWMPDGNLELLGRMDNQVKIRGYRIELGEIESRLRKHPAVKEGVVTTRVDAAGERRLVAYVVQDPAWQGAAEEQEDLGAEQVEQWQAVYDHAYGKTDHDGVEDPTFNIVSWDSSYTNAPLPAEEMRTWVEQTVDRIQKHHPSRVLEIGCGMGLLLFRIAPYCTRYIGTDFSKVALDYVARHRDRLGLKQVELDKRWADDFTGIEEDSLDSVVLNSIVLDFPSMDYLMQVLLGSVRAVQPGGKILVGDVRSLPLIEVYQSSVQLYQADASTPVDQVRARVARLIRQEEELVIDPRFFAWLQSKLPKIGHVQVQLKRGSFTNELNAFRYDVTLHIGPAPVAAPQTARWLDGDRDRVDVGKLRSILSGEKPEWLGVREVRNARVQRDACALRLLSDPAGPATAGEVRDAASAQDRAQPGLDPEALWELGAELGYDVDVRWSPSASEGRFDVAFHERTGRGTAAVLFPDESGLSFDPASRAADFANNPMLGKLARQLGPELRKHLSRQLPEYMVPAVYVPLDAMPLSPNGKVDRKALPEPDTSRPDMETQYQPPQTPVEAMVAGIWADVLGLDRVGIDDAFLDLGGHSLLAVQIQARLSEILPFEISLPDIFESRTVARLSKHLEVLGAKNGVDVTEVCQTVQMIDSMSDEEVRSRIASGP
jgi:amino acid adenylation domain-containing protein